MERRKKDKKHKNRLQSLIFGFSIPDRWRAWKGHVSSSFMKWLEFDWCVENNVALSLTKMRQVPLFHWY
jgi:hypothetical protein